MKLCSMVAALILAALLVGAAHAQTMLPPLAVTTWGQSEVNEDGNLRFRITASAGGITWECCLDALYLQLWARVVGGPGNATDTFVLIKSKDAYDASFTPAKPAANVGGTSSRFKLPRGTYSYSLFVVLNDSESLSTSTVLAESSPHAAGTVTIP